jgi:hypothetical protein
MDPQHCFSDSATFVTGDLEYTRVKEYGAVQE